jgi:hypothetical protein
MRRQQIEHLSHHPWRLLHDIWQWEWHALTVWGLVTAIALPLLAMYLRRALVLLMRRHKALLRSRPAVLSSMTRARSRLSASLHFHLRTISSDDRFSPAEEVG